MRKLYVSFITAAILLLTAVTGFAQGLVKGRVIDAVTKEPLPGASVLVKGTAKGGSTKLDGTFSINVTETNSATLTFSFIGYVTKELDVTGISGTKDVGSISLESSANLSEVVVTANNVAIDRRTPVAVSSVGSVQIEEKAAQQEFPELLKSTPGVYASKGAGGGYGDSRINMRGFQSANIAVMINGIPVNDPESGRVFWSNWAGLTDVTRSMQVQRGLGASKVAVPSLGGTINILTRGTEANGGGFIQQGLGNNNYSKTSFLFSTGLNEKGWAFSAMGSRTSGDGWFEGLAFEAYSYFFNVSKLINKSHTLSLTGFGAPQYHGSRFERYTIDYYRNAPQGIRVNPNWGVLNGKDRTISGNFYHKPQASLNHYWTINETSSLSTAVYGSIGRGGNEFPNNANLFLDTRVNGDKYSPVDLNALVAQNVASTDGRAVAYLQSNRNDHEWYGLLSTYTRKLNDKIDLLAGLDFRNYKGIKYNSVRNLLGAEYVMEQYNLSSSGTNAGNINNPLNRAKTGDKIQFHNDVIVLWQGGFLQGEYTDGPLSTFVSLAASNTSYKRKDYFRYLNTDPLRESDYVNFFGYQAKGGANYNLTRNHNVFANLGYFEKAPFFSAVFVSNQNVPNKDAEKEKILSYELGYGYRSRSLSANLNLYRTNWKDRSSTRSLLGNDGNFYTANLLGVDALHQGVELDFKYNPFKNLTLTGMISVGDWTWSSNLNRVEVFDAASNLVVSEGPIYTKGIKVGDAPQTTGALGLDFTVTQGIKIGADYNYYGSYYASFLPTDIREENLQPWQVPNYSLLDLNAVFKFKLANLNTSLFFNVNNVLNTEYISDANAQFRQVTNGPDISDAANSQVYFGAGRTWTTGLKVNF
ncbi:TonB-dependent receptor [Pedobacter sp. SYSU D00535]|uniref:TonB-dependent receptor n=1 Tax=Pedobacter sp. SYSU D00535 TaxID=2810308 RepID=UPI001A95AD80|nr:TonB-dependent receptor [Pedobacter sp. SYSU D00535]